jgi:DNA-directed RNA polymerase specialized sigma24 family protein
VSEASAEDRSHELRALPETYALALRLLAEGLDDPAIARVLDIEVESVAPLLALARAKLAAVTERVEDPGQAATEV